MHYTDLVAHTKDLATGKHAIYDLPDGRVEIHNLGVRHPAMSPRAEFRLEMLANNRRFIPRHGDLFADFMLKVDARPTFRLPLSEACEQICNGVDPQSLMQTKNFPRLFAEPGEATWSMQTGMDQTGGLPTELFLCGLQALVRVYDLNEWLERAPEAFRQAFLKLEKGEPLPAVLRELQPHVRREKRYFNRLER